MWPFGFWNKYPYTNFHEMNDDWVLCKIRQLDATMSAFVKNWSSPVLAYSYVDFVDKKLIYLYVGDEAGYNQNHWYYWDEISNSWKDGGLYGAADFTEDDIIAKLPAEFGYNFRRVDRQFIVNDGTNAYNQHGGTVISDHEVVYALLDPDYLQNNVAHIISHDLDAHTYTEKGQLIIGHCDSMAYDMEGNKLYIAPAYKAVNGVEVQDGTIYVYDYSTLTLMQTIPGVNAKSVAYDNDNKVMYYTTFLNEWKTADGETLFTFDSDWTSSRQGMFCYDNGFYLVTAFPNNIRQFDSTGKVIRDIPLREFYDWFLVGEMQWAGVIGDRLIVGSMIDSEDASEKYPTIWETNLKTNIYPSHDYSSSHVMTTMNVDVSSTAYNPTGSSGQRFKSINEAMLYASIRRTIHEMDLYDGTYEGRINLNMSIIGNDNTILVPTFKSCACKIDHCAQVNNAIITDGCFVQSPLEFTPDSGFYYLQKNYQEETVQDSGWTYGTTSNFIRGQTVFLKLDMNSGVNVPSSNWTTIVTGYPKPRQNWFAMNSDRNGNIYRLRVNTNGELAIANLSGNVISFDTTFVYPIG